MGITTREEVINVLKTIIDPEIFIDIWTLGLIYQIEFRENGILYLQITFTSATCPLAPAIIEEIKQKTMLLEGITNTEVEVVFQPPWQPSDELKGLMGLL
ncbi:MAG: metal-sulfur cluster assembly factor [Deltaproteobacteria bacterium]|jgi:metal-sulfur cluster biosynthetic enzyme|nr:metal-sulfur cluster assembly factor [Deltaproteobacteria bacterium]